MKTIEITDEIFELLELYIDKNKNYNKTYSELIKWWHDETFNSRRSTMNDRNFGR